MSKTKPNEPTTAVKKFLHAIEHPVRKADALRLDKIMREETGFKPRLWSGKMVGYGRYEYTYESGHSGECLATGFAPSKSKQTLYIMPGYQDLDDQLERLWKHKKGKCCLYINKLEDVDEDVLREIIRFGLDDLATKWEIHPA